MLKIMPSIAFLLSLIFLNAAQADEAVVMSETPLELTQDSPGKATTYTVNYTSIKNQDPKNQHILCTYSNAANDLFVKASNQIKAAQVQIHYVNGGTVNLTDRTKSTTNDATIEAPNGMTLFKLVKSPTQHQNDNVNGSRVNIDLNDKNVFTIRIYYSPALSTQNIIEDDTRIPVKILCSFVPAL